MKSDHIVSINKEFCNGCGLCPKDCPSGAIAMTDGKATVTTQSCLKCGHCVAICPQNAVSVSGFEDAPEPLTPAMKVDADALLGQLKARRSMRQFTSQEVAPEIIAQIIEAGRYTPTGSNSQGVSYVVLQKNIVEYEKIALIRFRRMKKLMDTVSNSFRNMTIDDHFLFKNAPVVIVIKATSVTDGALAASSMELMAQSLGLGVLYSGFFSMLAGMVGTLRKRLGVQRGEKIVTTLVIGYPAVKYQRTAQRERPAVRYD